MSQVSRDEVETQLSVKSDFTLISTTSFNYLDAKAMAQDFSIADHSRIILGGPHVSIVKEEVFNDGPWHAAVAGEGEKVIVHALNDKLPESVPGLIVPDSSGNQPPERIADLDSLARPYYSLFPMHKYPNHVLLTSRGCPFSCSFCAAPVINGSRWYYRSIPDVIDEMSALRTDFGDKLFHLNDDNFTLRRERVLEFCELLLKKNNNFRWVAQGVRADRVDSRLLRLMHKAGCQRISIGVESADPSVLAAIGKKESVSQIEKAIHLARDAGLEVLSMFVIGTSSDSLAATRKSFEFVRRNTLFPVDFYQLIPYPGTLEWQDAQKRGRFLLKDYREFDHYSREPVFETDQFTAQERKTAVLEASLLVKQMEKKWFWKKHLRFFLPHLLIHRSFHEIIEETSYLLRRISGSIKKRVLRK